MDWLFFRKPRACHFEIDLLAFRSQVQPTTHTIAGNDLQRCIINMHFTPETKTAEDRIVRDNSRSSTQCAAVAEIGLGRVVPGTAVVRLSKPCHAVGRRLKAATCSTIVCLARKPVAEAALLRASIHEGPRAKDGCESETNRGVGFSAVVQCVVEHAPATHRR